MPALSDHPELTRQRLLLAGAEEFAEHGFRQTTVRDICRRAGANVAAVNYHFRDKQGLYAAVLQHGLATALAQHPPDKGVDARTSAPIRLRAFVHSFLLRLLSEGSYSPHARIMVREMAESTPALDIVVREHITPLSARLMGIVKEIIGPGASVEQIRHGAMSIVGQCCFYRHAEQVIDKLFSPAPRTTGDIERLADHITRFSVAGLHAVGKSSTPAGPTKRRSR